MPTVPPPVLDPGASGIAPVGNQMSPPSPANVLMAAASLSAAKTPSRSIPSSGPEPLQVSKRQSKKPPLKVVR